MWYRILGFSEKEKLSAKVNKWQRQFVWSWNGCVDIRGKVVGSYSNDLAMSNEDPGEGRIIKGKCRKKHAGL